MKQNHYTAEFKKVIVFAEEMSKHAVQWCYGIDETILCGRRNKRSN
jgi:hypothetical protein